MPEPLIIKSSLSSSHFPVVDILKALACLIVVSHHLAFYGPMSDIALPLFPHLIEWLYNFGRMAVQIFLVVSGFLTANQLMKIAHEKNKFALMDVLSLTWSRYKRLFFPYAVSLFFVIIISAFLRLWFNHESLSNPPEFWQMMAHLFFLQNILNFESLSAGVWYISIDLQLYALGIFLCWLAKKIFFERFDAFYALFFLTLIVALFSLFFFNLNSAWDKTALYFFGSYAFGLIGRWIINYQYHSKKHYLGGLFLISIMGLSALQINFRERLIVALFTTFILIVTFDFKLNLFNQSNQFGNSNKYTLMIYQLFKLSHHIIYNVIIRGLSQISYSIFLIHFPVCLLFNAIFSYLFPTDALINFIGMILALLFSVISGYLFWYWIESKKILQLNTFQKLKFNYYILL